VADFGPPPEGEEPPSWDQGPPQPPHWQQGPPQQQAWPSQQPNPQQPPWAAPTYNYPEESQAVTAIIVAIIGIMFCQILSPVGWYLGKKEMNAIDGGRRDPKNRTEAKVAYVLGIIGTVIIGAVFAIFGLLIVALAIGASA